MMTGLIQIVIGFAGVVGFFLRFIGPLTIAPTITLMGISLFSEAAESAGKSPYQLLHDLESKSSGLLTMKHLAFLRLQVNTGEFQ